MKRRNQTTVTIIGPEQRGFLPKTSVLMSSVGDEKYFHLNWLHFVSNGQVNTGYFGLASENEMACEITSLNLKQTRFSGALDSGCITDMYNGEDNRSIEFIFPLKSKQGFCESSLEIAVLILESLGVTKSDIKLALRGSHSRQNPEVRYRGTWMSYWQYLLLTHPLIKAAQIP